MAGEQTASSRSRGRVVRFSDRKGFGFIKPEDGGEDLFVHHSAIKSDGGYRSLGEDDVVEFTVGLSADNKYQAIDVTAPGGGPINKRTDAAKRGGFGFGGSWNRRSNGGGGTGCFNCGSLNHIARDCNNHNNNNYSNNDNGCFKCGDLGHFARDCPRANGGGGGGNGACFSCGGYGHMARDCPGGGKACYNCGGYGHMARDCTSARGSAGGGGGGGGNACYKCGQEGHFARECPNDS